MTCPNLLPSLDHPSGYYCRVDCGGECLIDEAKSVVSIHENSDSNEISRISGDGQAASMTSCGFKAGSVVWLPMTYYGVATWTEFTLVNDLYATASTMVDGRTVVDTLVVNDWFKERARSQPPQTVSDSAESRRSSDSREGNHAQDFPMENMSDSAKTRSRRFWHEAGPYISKGRLYYRYRWGHGDTIEGVRHIPGGSLKRGLVKERAKVVERAVYVDFRPHHEIVSLIDGWRRRRPGRSSQA